MSSPYEQDIDLDRVNGMLAARLRESSPRSHTHESKEQIRRRLNVNAFGYFLLKLAKADLYAVSICTDNSRNNLYSLGFMVLFTAALAFLSSWYTFSTMLLPPNEPSSYLIGFGLALVYMGGIIIIDREIVSAVKSSFSTTLIRLVFAALIATAISYPIKLKLFEGRLDAVIGQMIEEESAGLRNEQVRIQEQIDAIGKRFESIQSDERSVQMTTLENLGSEKLVLSRRLDEELGRGGIGPKSRELQSLLSDLNARIDAQRSNLESISNRTISEQDRAYLQGLESRFNQLEQQIIHQKASSYDLLTKWQASERLKKEEGASYLIISWFVIAFFFALEMVPALLKFALGKSEYNYYLEARQNINSQKIVSIANLYIDAMQRDPQNALQTPTEITDWMHASMEDEVTPYIAPRTPSRTASAPNGSGESSLNGSPEVVDVAMPQQARVDTTPMDPDQTVDQGPNAGRGG